MGADSNLIFLEVIEWFDETGTEIVRRIPQKGSGEIKYGAQLIVRESQAGVFFYNGKAVDAFGPGRHTLKTSNIPILNKLLSVPWGLTSPLRAEVYMVNMKLLPNLKWGTREPVAFKDSQLGLIRLRAYGVYSMRVIQPVLFINSISGTMGSFTTEEIQDYLRCVIVSRLNDCMGEGLDSVLTLPGRYEEFSRGLEARLGEDFKQLGLALSRLYITSITPPVEVQKAIDDKSRLNLLQDLDSLLKLKAAMAMEKVSDSSSGAGAGLGMGLGFMMPAMFAQMMGVNKGITGSSGATCVECASAIPTDSRFCPYCGHQQLVFQRCAGCGKNLSPNAAFCPRCGVAAAAKRPNRTCPGCGEVNMPQSVYCNRCGDKLPTNGV